VILVGEGKGLVEISWVLRNPGGGGLGGWFGWIGEERGERGLGMDMEGFGLRDFGSGGLPHGTKPVEGISRSDTRHTGRLPRAGSMYDQVYGGGITAGKGCPRVGRC